MEELAKYEAGEPKPLTALEIRAQVNLIQEVMKNVMQSGQHYGKIPGAGDKPTLLKPGAEKIMATFRLAPDPEITDLSANGYIRYQIKCRLISPSGRYLGAGVGEASTDEEKYRWRAVVSEEEWNATPELERRIKFKKPYQNQPTQIKQIRTNPADLANTVLKMAKKRALVDAVITITGCSDIFTQDIEDIPEEMLQKKEVLKQEQVTQPQEPPKQNGKVKEDFPSIMARERKRLGDKTFSMILGNNGFERIEDITKREDQIKVYKVMVAYPKDKEERQPGRRWLNHEGQSDKN